MRTQRATFASLLALALVSIARSSAADNNMDPTPERLVVQPAGLPPGQSCQSLAADPAAVVRSGRRPQDFTCKPSHLGFQNMMSELGYAIAPSAFNPARTTGLGGFNLTIEASYARIWSERSVENADGSQTPYWKLGTRGPQDSNTKQSSIINTSPDSVLQIYSLKARKGLPLGFELVGAFGYIANTTLWVVGGDLRWSLLEGFRTGAMGILPDVSLGGGVRTITGTSRFYLTTVGIDVKASKPITLADTAQLIPSVGYQRIIIFGDSNVVDSTPNVDALKQCGYQGPNPVNGTPVCQNKLPNGADANTDFANNFTFQQVRVHRNRGLVGLHYKYEIIWLGAQVAFDITQPKDENPGIIGNRQWTLSFEGGVAF